MENYLVVTGNDEIKSQENFDGHGVLQSAFKHGAYLLLIYIENFQVKVNLVRTQRS